MYIYIRSMSESQSRIYDKIADKAVSIDKHIIKLMLYPSAPECNHWKSEIYSFLNNVQKLKGSNKFPKAKLILKALTISNDMIDKLAWQVQCEEESLIPIHIEVDVLIRTIEAYQSWLASMLSSDGLVVPKDVYSKLDELISEGGQSCG